MQKSALRRHHNTFHAAKPTVFSCEPPCAEKFSRLDLLKAHQGRPHACKAKNICEVCHEHVSYSLKTHVEKFLCPRRHICEDCGAGFATLDNYNTHMEIGHITEVVIEVMWTFCNLFRAHFLKPSDLINIQQRVNIFGKKAYSSNILHCLIDWLISGFDIVHIHWHH